MTTTADVRARALAALLPPPRLKLSDWIEANVVLPDDVSALPGRVRLWPHQREIADAITDPLVERITIVKPARAGFTTLLTSAIGYYTADDPCPILALLPTESDARDYVVSDVEPVFAATPALRGSLSFDTGEGIDRNTLLHRRFPGGSLKVVAARSPRNLRRHTARVLIVDEADACETTPEGNPLRLAERRTLSYPNRKLICGSTPIFEETSHVLRSYAASDGRVFECPCPECGAFAELLWSAIEWEPDKPETAAWRCPHCRSLVPERAKFRMVTGGQWRATRPEIKGHAGFRCSALISLLANASWGRLAAEFLAARGDPAELMAFTNTVLAEGWQEVGAELDDAALAARAEPFGLDAIPPEVLIITVGCDCQDDRIEATVAGWTREAVCLVLGHVVIWGSVADDPTLWIELDELLKSKWKHPHGGWLRLCDGLPIRVAAFSDAARRLDRSHDRQFDQCRLGADGLVIESPLAAHRFWPLEEILASLVRISLGVRRGGSCRLRPRRLGLVVAGGAVRRGLHLFSSVGGSTRTALRVQGASNMFA
jgi:phage terminase large subunit GpA-like protein